MPGYVDPFANRSSRHEAIEDGPDASSEDAVVVIDDDDEDPTERDDVEIDPIGLDAIADDAEHGRREAPFADDPRHRVRSA